MAAKTGAVWAIDIGNNSLKALHLSTERGVFEVIGFDNIQHGKILSGGGIKAAERDELVALSFRKFVSKHDLSGDDIIVSVPSQNSFARFVNLPPVESKRIPEIVRFEAVQQIPFDINDVQWDWQLMTETGSREVKVGIFAIKNEVVNSALEHFSRENVQVSYVQMAPMALYNYVLYDRPNLVKSDTQATVVLNIGADNTDLVVCTKSTVWQRCILIGGNTFTKAIADTFKLNFEKAEKLKRTAPVSKYARQIFQAMRPVFTDLASEIQRSLGFYNSSNPNTKIVKIIALGGGTKLRGLLKYLQQTLRILVERPDSFKRLAISSGVSAAKFHESVCDFGIVYGLGLQGLGLARIESNLLPRNIARSMAWAGKGRYFTAAACVLLLVSLMCLARTGLDRMTYTKNAQFRRETSSVLDDVRQAGEKLEAEKRKGSDSEAIIQKAFEPFKYRDVIPLLYQTIISALPNEKNNSKQSRLYKAFANGDVEGVLEIPRKERKQIFITGTSVFFTSDLATAQFGGIDFQRGDIRRRSSEELEDEDIEFEIEMGRRGYEGGASPYKYSVPFSTAAGTGETVEEKKAGFVVTIAGYSPHKSIGELMDPAGVEGEPDKWGFITRLLHLDELVDGNSPFELYKKTVAEHFNLDKGPVNLNAEIPAGIGLLEVGDESGVSVLVDPMTKEVINSVVELDEYGKQKLDRSGRPIYKVNDQWFVLNVKFVWKDAPKEAEEIGAAGLSGRQAARTSPSRTTAPKITPSVGTRKPDAAIDW